MKLWLAVSSKMSLTSHTYRYLMDPCLPQSFKFGNCSLIAQWSMCMNLVCLVSNILAVDSVRRVQSWKLLTLSLSAVYVNFILKGTVA